MATSEADSEGVTLHGPYSIRLGVHIVVCDIQSTLSLSTLFGSFPKFGVPSPISPRQDFSSGMTTISETSARIGVDGTMSSAANYCVTSAGKRPPLRLDTKKDSGARCNH